MAQYFEVTFLPPPGAVIGNALCEVVIIIDVVVFCFQVWGQDVDFNFVEGDV